jgi:hypothetical protein
MKYFIAVSILTVFFCGCSNQLSVSGKWKNGSRELQLTPDNNFILSDSGVTKFSGIYTVVFDNMQLINSGNNLSNQCIKPGRYSFTLADDTLQLTMRDDPCTERKLILNGTYWNKSR